MRKVVRALSFSAVLLCPAPAFAQSHSATLSWTPATQPNGITIASWNVLRETAGTGPYTTIANIPVGTTTYTDSSVSDGVTYYYVVQAVDTAGVVSLDSTQIEAAIPNSAPPLAITTTTLPLATAGISYSATFAASGGTGPYTWSGTGVDSLTFSATGLLSGTPSQAGTFMQGVTVKDSAEATANASLALSVDEPLSPQPPSVVSVTPGIGSGLGPKIFSYLYSDASGYQNISVVQTILNTTSNLMGSCGTKFQPASSSLYLIKDDGSSWLGPLMIGQPGTLQNSQCVLNAGASSATGSGTNLTVNLDFTFQPDFIGLKNHFMLAEDTVNNLTSGLQNRGTWIPSRTTGDFDGDGKADIAVFRPSSGTWFIIPSNNPGSPIIQQWGTRGDIPVPGDYDGDGKIDISVFRPSSATWFIIPSSNPGTPIVQLWGLPGDVPVPGDYDGDGKTDFAVWRPSTGQWLIIPSSNPGTPIVQSWGLNGDVPVPGDYDGDGKTDFAVWRPSTGQWLIIPSSNPGTPIIQSWGLNGDVPVPGDYDGDGKTDFAVWRPTTGQWFIIPSGNPATQITQSFGLDGDIPVPADYDGDQIADIAVWRPTTGQWYIIPSSSPMSFTVTSWGLSGDVPVQKPIGQ
jgi:hypothetical protein